jgi:putative DNA-invertase from lambdoid prophage Rac
MHAYGYVRSGPGDEDQAEQLSAITSFCMERRIELQRVFQDDGPSGSKPFTERPGGMLLLEAAKATPVNCLVVYEISRLGRSTMDTLNVILNILERPKEKEGLGLQLLSVKDEFMNNTEPTYRTQLLKVLSWFAEQERRRIRERQEAAWREGKQKGRPREIEPEELIDYVKKYPGLTMSALTKVMNADRERAGKRRLGYSTVRMLAKKLGLKWRLMVPRAEQSQGLNADGKKLNR